MDPWEQAIDCSRPPGKIFNYDFLPQWFENESCQRRVWVLSWVKMLRFGGELHCILGMVRYWGENSTTAGEVSRFQYLCPNPSWWVRKGMAATKNSLQYPWMDIWLMAVFLLVVELNLVKCRQRFSFLSGGKRSTLAQHGIERYSKIKDDDDVEMYCILGKMHCILGRNVLHCVFSVFFSISVQTGFAMCHPPRFPIR